MDETPGLVRTALACGARVSNRKQTRARTYAAGTTAAASSTEYPGLESNLLVRGLQCMP